MAAKVHQKATMSKSVSQQIRLNLNVMTKDNFKKKFGELREYLYPGLLSKQECEQEDKEWDESMLLNDENINHEILQLIVENIFRKAQLEKEYTIFYGELCEEMITLELRLRNEAAKISNMRNSQFRKILFNVCKSCFEKFFDAEEKKKSEGDKEKAIVFKLKLYGNLAFVGELYRRKILPESILNTVFESLLGMGEMSDEINDLVTEGAINLMNKVGKTYEANIAGSKSKKEEKQQKLDVIYNKFREIESLKDETLISNRIKILIKNMFTNRANGWDKEKDQQEPMSKEEVAKMV